MAQLPALPAGTRWSNLYGVTFDGGSVYADGTFVDPSTDANQVLLLKGTGGSWSVVGAPNPGVSNIAGGLANIDGTLWMSGMYSTATSHRQPLVEHT